jgi:hypothetical protein
MRIVTVRSKVTTTFLALALIAGAAVLSLSPSTGMASAADGTADVTFTKWVTDCSPCTATSYAGALMEGVVGGDVGTGAFRGKVLNDDSSVAGTWKGHARYEFYGKDHSFVGDVQVTENDKTDPATAVITGVVTDGWMKDSQVTGTYTVMPTCDIPTPGNGNGKVCFKGTLHLTAPTLTFTKWVTQATAFPWDMKGVVGGDVGTGTFTGEVLSLVDDKTTTKIHALYHANGGKQSLTADLQVAQTDATGAAVLSGVVTVGYLKDAQVTGDYKTLTVCDIPTPGNVNDKLCFKGTLHLAAASAAAPAVAPTTAPTLAPTQAPKPPATGNGSFADRGESSSPMFALFGGLALTLAGVAGLSALALRRSLRSPMP